MNASGRVKYVNVTPPAAIVDNAVFTTAAVDTKGYNRVQFIAQFGALDIAAASSKVRHSDASDMSSSADLLTGGTDYTLPVATDDNKIFVFDIDLRGKKRYLDFEITGGDGTSGTYLNVLAILSEPTIAPDSDTDRGVADYVTA